MKLYVKVSEDDLELPEAVAESRAELARMLGYGKNYVYTCMKRAKKNGTKPKVVEVEIEDD